MEGIITALTTAMTTVSTNVMDVVADVLPIGLSIFAVGIVINYAMKFFKRITSKG